MRVKLLHLVTAQSCRIYDTCAYGCALFLHGFGNPQRAVLRQTAPSASEEEAVNKEATSGAPPVLIRVSVVVPFEPKGDDVSYVHDGTTKRLKYTNLRWCESQRMLRAHVERWKADNSGAGEQMKAGTGGTNRHRNKLTDSSATENLSLLAKFEYCFNPPQCARVHAHVGVSSATSPIVLVTRILGVTIYLCLFCRGCRLLSPMLTKTRQRDGI